MRGQVQRLQLPLFAGEERIDVGGEGQSGAPTGYRQRRDGQQKRTRPARQEAVDQGAPLAFQRDRRQLVLPSRDPGVGGSRARLALLGDAAAQAQVAVGQDDQPDQQHEGRAGRG